MRFQAIFQLQTMLPTHFISSKHTGSIKFDAKWVEKKLCLSLWPTHWNRWFCAISKYKRTENLTVSMQDRFYFTNEHQVVFATCENTCFGVIRKIKINLHWKRQISSICSFQYTEKGCQPQSGEKICVAHLSDRPGGCTICTYNFKQQ